MVQLKRPTPCLVVEPHLVPIRQGHYATRIGGFLATTHRGSWHDYNTEGPDATVRVQRCDPTGSDTGTAYWYGPVVVPRKHVHFGDEIIALHTLLRIEPRSVNRALQEYAQGLWRAGLIVGFPCVRNATYG